MSAAVIAQILARGLRRGVEPGEDFLDRFFLQPRCGGDSDIQLRDVGGVMLVVMNLDRKSVV